MIVKNTTLQDVKMIIPETFEDFRGEYVEIYNKKEYNQAGIDIDFIQDDYSWSSKHVLRGLHGDSETWKLVDCLHGKFYLVVLDLNKESSTYQQWEAFTLSQTNKIQILIPPNHANGHLILSEKAIFHYKQSAYYSPDGQFTVKFNDLKYNIWWPIKEPILSRRDEKGDYV